MAEEFEPTISILKAERQRRGMSLEMVHEATKIPLDVLRAIEEGYKVRTLSPFYYKAFIKTYAKYLEVDQDEAIEQFKAQEDSKGMRLTKSAPKKEFRPPQSKLDKHIAKFWTKERQQAAIKAVGGLLLLIVVFKVVGFLGGQLLNWMDSLKKPKVRTEAVVTEITQSAQRKKVTGSTLEKKETVSKSESKSKSQPKPQPTITRTTVPAASTLVQSNQSQSKPASSINEGVTVTVRATRDAFLIVQADSRTVFQSKFPNGSVETWSGEESIIISGRNIGYLEFEVNGRMIGALSRGDAKAKKVIISENGLSVQK